MNSTVAPLGIVYGQAQVGRLRPLQKNIRQTYSSGPKHSSKSAQTSQDGERQV